MRTDGESDAARGLDASKPPGAQGYDQRRLSYANTFDSPLRAFTIRATEWLTGKITIIRMLREFQRRAPHDRADFWADALDVMQVDIQTPKEQLDRIPREGPLVVVANHPFGILDGLLMGHILSTKRREFRIIAHHVFRQAKDRWWWWRTIPTGWSMAWSSRICSAAGGWTTRCWSAPS